jgi:hypothetical protein
VISHKKCDELIELINTTDLTTQDFSAEKLNNVECSEFNLSKYLDKDEYKNNDDYIMNIISECFKMFYLLRPTIRITSDTGYILRKIHGQTYNHIDWIYKDKNECRTLSVIIGLNDNYDGGYFCFSWQNVVYKLKKGSIIMFPPYWTHPHSVTPIKRGQYRYTINTWAK